MMRVDPKSEDFQITDKYGPWREGENVTGRIDQSSEKWDDEEFENKVGSTVQVEPGFGRACLQRSKLNLD
jgi:hypothetical protein